jgi:hypothetical protein
VDYSWIKSSEPPGQWQFGKVAKQEKGILDKNQSGWRRCSTKLSHKTIILSFSDFARGTLTLHHYVS